MQYNYTKKQIALEIGVSERTIYRELKRGKLILLNLDLTYREENSSEYKV